MIVKAYIYRIVDTKIQRMKAAGRISFGIFLVLLNRSTGKLKPAAHPTFQMRLSRAKCYSVSSNRKCRQSPFKSCNRVYRKRSNHASVTSARSNSDESPKPKSQSHDADDFIISVSVEDFAPTVNDLKNRNNINDQIISAISGNGSIKVTVATVRNLVNEFMQTHSMTEVPADAIGRLTTCALLMSNGMKDEQTVQLSINGDGPLRGALAISSARGEVRGYVGNAGISGFTLEEAVGKGTVQVVKNHPEWSNPYNGITAIRNGDIDRDVGLYLAESEQRSCALAAATSVSGVLCNAAGGYLVERLPECDEETMQRVEKNLCVLVTKDGSSKVPTLLLANGWTPVHIAEVILDGLDMKPLQNLSPMYKCNCSPNRLFRSLRLLPRVEVDDIIAKHGQVEARCHFCGRVYRLSAEEVNARFATATGDPSKDV